MNEEDVFSEPIERNQKEKDFTSLFCWQDARKMKLNGYIKYIQKLKETDKKQKRS